ncbi:DNA primase [Rubrivivax sp. RP6-9]|uniref:DNA primase n=1 Tax=Rubrivivax sp. RP6-9 TaxID=3415750 RepID=UPI003CC55738
MIPPGFIQELLSRVDVVDVVGRHVELKRGGANLMGLCPFHGEKSPSFSVSPSKQFYYCFGCGASGDAIRFLTEHLGLSFVEAVRDLAQGAGLTVPEEQVSADEQVRRDKLRERRLSMGELLTKATDFYRGQLRASPRAIDYLKRRGLTGAIAARFGLGYAPPGWRTLAGVFPRYDDPLLEEAGLVRTKDGEDGAAADADRGRYDWFRDRVMFPIRAVGGEVIGFGGRVLDDSKPKYINSPETPLFSKGRELYGLFEARAALREKGYALVVEGYMDVVALAQSGFANAVATLGTACTADHVQKLFRFTDAVVFAFDGDAAGRRAAGRALEASLPHASDLRSVKFLFLPPEHDPDSFVRTLGAPAFEAAVAAAVPLSRQLVEQASEDADLSTAEGRARMLAQAKPLWQALPDGALKRQLLPELARQAGLASDDLVALWGGAAAPQRAAPGAQPPMPAPRRAPRGGGRRAPAGPADLALRLLLRHSDWWERLSGDDHHLLHDLGGRHGDAVAWLERQITEHGPQTWAALDEALQAESFRDEARQWVGSGTLDEEHSFEDLQRVMHRLWREHFEQEARALTAEGRTDREHLDRLRACHERIKLHRTAEITPPS